MALCLWKKKSILLENTIRSILATYLYKSTHPKKTFGRQFVMFMTKSLSLKFPRVLASNFLGNTGSLVSLQVLLSALCSFTFFLRQQKFDLHISFQLPILPYYLPAQRLTVE